MKKFFDLVNHSVIRNFHFVHVTLNLLENVFLLMIMGIPDFVKDDISFLIGISFCFYKSIHSNFNKLLYSLFIYCLSAFSFSDSSFRDIRFRILIGKFSISIW